MEKYFLNYLKNASEDRLFSKYISLLKSELDWHFYATGEDLAQKYHRNQRKSFDVKTKDFVKLLSCFFSIKEPLNERKQVLSFFRFPVNLDNISFYSSIIEPVGGKNIVGDLQTYKYLLYVKKVIQKYDFNRILSQEVICRLEEEIDCLNNLYFIKNDFKAIFLYTDQFFTYKQHIQLFKEKGRPSFIFTHGLPGVYSKDVDNSSDYLMVWGEKMRQNYIEAGFNPDKVFVIGNFRYKTIPKVTQNLRNSLKDVLVVSSSSVTWHQNTWDEPATNDRSLLLLFLYQVENALKRNGVSHARLRPHPAVNKIWLRRFIDNSFYSLDNDSLVSSLRKSTLVIGQTSSVVIESMMQGVNYIAFEPIDKKGYSVRNAPAAPPFDGKDPYLCLAKNEDDLIYMIREKCMSDTRLIQEYIQPFEPQVLNEIIKKTIE